MTKKHVALSYDSTPRLENSIDNMVSALEEKVQENNLDKNLPLFYILDLTPVMEEQINNEEYETPVILSTEQMLRLKHLLQQRESFVHW
eukprot:10576925-Ditylum_brightwellii.AAC.1